MVTCADPKRCHKITMTWKINKDEPLAAADVQHYAKIYWRMDGTYRFTDDVTGLGATCATAAGVVTCTIPDAKALLANIHDNYKGASPGSSKQLADRPLDQHAGYIHGDELLVVSTACRTAPNSQSNNKYACCSYDSAASEPLVINKHVPTWTIAGLTKAGPVAGIKTRNQNSTRTRFEISWPMPRSFGSAITDYEIQFNDKPDGKGAWKAEPSLCDGTDSFVISQRKCSGINTQ